MAITSVLKPAVQAAIKKFIKDKSTLAGVKEFRKKFNPLRKDGEGGYLNIPQRKFIADEIGVEDYTKISQKTGREKVPFGEKRKGEKYITKETSKKLSDARVKNLIKEGKYPMKPGKKTYQMYIDDASKAFRVSNDKAKKSPEIMGAVQIKRAESALFPERNTPWNQLFERYNMKPSDFKNLVEGRTEMQAKLPFNLLDDLEIFKPGMRTGSIGHTMPLSRLREIAIANPNIPREDLMKLAIDPRYMEVQPNFFNQALSGIESLFYNPKYANAPFGMQRATSALDEGQLTSRILRPGIMDIETYGMGNKAYDYKLLTEYLKRLRDERPYGLRVTRKTGAQRPRLLPDISFLKKRFAAGGIANIGAKILPKLAKKLSEKELKLVMETLFKGTNPSKSLAKKREANLIKKLGADKYRWRNVKSEVPGPQASNVVKFPSAGALEDIYRSGRLADRKWEQEMLKKLKLAENTELKYPFLNPENNAFIVTGPRTSLGRYQMSGIMDTEAAIPVSKYAVYDWWDDILKQMRKKPKFKYVKDDKGNTIMKKVK